MYEFGVVGLGPAGCFFLACLPEEAWARTVVFDSAATVSQQQHEDRDTCIGGDLRRYYENVVANLPCQKLAAAFHAIPRWKDETLTVFEKYAPDACPYLGDIAGQLCEFVKPLLPRMAERSTEHIVEARMIPGGWRLVGNTGATWTVTKLVVCTGGEPRQLDSLQEAATSRAIPLDIALDAEQLRAHVGSADRVVVFGTAHSGLLILRNLREAGCQHVSAIYRSASGPPFRWARPHDTECPCHLLGGTGCHDSEGVKQEAAAIADAIVRGEWGAETPHILRSEDVAAVGAALKAATAVVYAVGFQSRLPQFYGLGGDLLNIRHDPQTAQVAPGVWGFGLAFPSCYETPRGTVAPDVGLPAFAAHIQRCMPGILQIY